MNGYGGEIKVRDLNGYLSLLHGPVPAKENARKLTGYRGDIPARIYSHLKTKSIFSYANFECKKLFFFCLRS